MCIRDRSCRERFSVVKTLERDRYALCEKHVIVPFCCSHHMYRYLAGCFGLISCRHYLLKKYFYRTAFHKIYDKIGRPTQCGSADRFCKREEEGAFAYSPSMAILSLTKLSSLMACSMRQASCSACSGSTPAAISRFVKNWCRS